MAVKKGSSAGKNDNAYIRTQTNLDKKGKTNKKLKSSGLSTKFLTATGKDLKDKAAALSKETFKKGRRTKKKLANAS